MKIIDIFEYVLLDYSSNKFKTTLSSLGIIIGVVAVVALLSIGDGLQAGVTNAFGSMELNTITILPGGPTNFESNKVVQPPAELSDRDISIIENIIGIKSAAPRNQVYGSVQFRGTTSAVVIEAISPKKETTLANSIETGRFLTSSDINSIVVGNKIASSVFPSKLHPGTSVKLSDTSGEPKDYLIVGILKNHGPGSLFGDTDNQIFVTHSGMKSISDFHSYSQILVTTRDVNDVEKIQNEIDELLHRVHRNEAYSIMTMKSFSEGISGIFSMIKIALMGIGTLALLIGGIGITNVMMLTVRERTKEIGLMKAVGATRMDVRLTFLLEASLLGTVSGIIGIILGSGIALSISFIGQIPTMISMNTVFLGLAFGIVTTSIAGIYPADQASKLDPIEALRYE